MSFALAVADAQNGTAVATVTGSDAGSSNVVYAAPVSQGPAPVFWRPVGTRTGDGTVTVTLDPALYYFYATGLVSAVQVAAPPLIQSLSLSPTAVQEQVEAAILARCQTLTLAAGTAGLPAALPASHMVRFPVLSEEILLLAPSLPCLLVTKPQVPESQPGKLNNRDDIGYPCLVTLLDNAGTTEQDRLPTYSLWRQQIFRAIRHQRLSGAPTVMTVEVEPQPIVSWKPPEWLKIFSSIQFRAISRESRG